MIECSTCDNKQPTATAGICVDIDGGYWHEPGSCRYCDPICHDCNYYAEKVES
jgi:hypothetical protein